MNGANQREQRVQRSTVTGSMRAVHGSAAYRSDQPANSSDGHNDWRRVDLADRRQDCAAAA